MDKGFLVIGLFAVIFLAGCATVSDEVSVEKMSSTQRLYVGRLKVRLNEDKNPKCEVYLNNDISPSIRLSQSGWIIYKTDRKELRLRRLACYQQINPYEAAWHLHDLMLTSVLKSEDKSQVKYFGNLDVAWTVDPISTSQAARLVTVSGYPKEGRVEDSGELKISFTDNEREARDEFYKKLPADRARDYQSKKDLIGAGR